MRQHARWGCRATDLQQLKKELWIVANDRLARLRVTHGEGVTAAGLHDKDAQVEIDGSLDLGDLAKREWRPRRHNRWQTAAAEAGKVAQQRK